MRAYLLPQEAAVVNGCQISVVDLDQLVQVLCLLHLVLKLQSCAVQNLQRDDAHGFNKDQRRLLKQMWVLSCSL